MRVAILVGVVCWVLLSATTAYASTLRQRTEKQDPCLAWIVDHENRSWDPRIQGGLPQAQPMSKMASAGSDWATNPYTQLRWMRGYVKERYGGSCQAEAHWKSMARYYQGDWHGGSY